ncbi:MAG: tetraacyldisaccharide 4'-kinase, partial [Hydrogenophaga sp.]|nr:tetraacyldisaccharide 4'-kinase [Hydrogenophaga sp.]
MSQAGTEAAWQAVWLGRGWRARLLWPLSLLYGWLIRRRRRRFASGTVPVTHLPVPVIVVGNVVTGGAGKTPTVLALLDHLMASGWCPGVVSRGHGRTGTDVLALSPDVPA